MTELLKVLFFSAVPAVGPLQTGEGQIQIENE